MQNNYSYQTLSLDSLLNYCQSTQRNTGLLKTFAVRLWINSNNALITVPALKILHKWNDWQITELAWKWYFRHTMQMSTTKNSYKIINSNCPTTNKQWLWKNKYCVGTNFKDDVKGLFSTLLSFPLKLELIAWTMCRLYHPHELCSFGIIPGYICGKKIVFTYTIHAVTLL